MKFSTYARRRAQGFGPAFALHAAEKHLGFDVAIPLGVILVCAIYLVAEVIDLFIL